MRVNNAAHGALGPSHDINRCVWTALCCLRVDRSDSWETMPDRKLAASHRARFRAGLVRRAVLERVVDFAFPRQALLGGQDAAVVGGSFLLHSAIGNKDGFRLPLGLHRHYKCIYRRQYDEAGPQLCHVALSAVI